MGLSRQECWSGLPFPSPGDLPDPGIQPTSLTSPALAVGFFTTSAPWEALMKPVPGAESLGTAALKSGSRRVLDKNWQEKGQLQMENVKAFCVRSHELLESFVLF